MLFQMNGNIIFKSDYSQKNEELSISNRWVVVQTYTADYSKQKTV